MQTFVLCLLGMNSVSTLLCIWMVYRVLQGKPKFKPIQHRNAFVPTRKMAFKGPNVEMGYYVPREDPKARPILVTHFIEQDATGGVSVEADTYVTESGTIFPGEVFRSRFATAPVAQEVRVMSGRRLAPARSTDRLG